MPAITRKQFEKLMTEDIYDTTPAGREIAGNESGGTFAQYGSWAVWNSLDSAPVKAAQDASLLTEWDRIEGVLHNDVVLVALNLGRPKTAGTGAGTGRINHEGAWENFHSGSRDFVLGQATERSPFRGAYITDFYKGLPTYSGAELQDLLRTLSTDDPLASSTIATVMRSILDREINILDAHEAPLVCLGADAHKAVTRAYGSDKIIEHVSHYSGAVERDAYAAQFADLVSKLGL